MLPAISICNFKKKHIIQSHESDEKPHFAPDLIWSTNSLFKNLISSVTRDHNQLSSCTTSENNIDSIFRKISDEQTDGQRGRQRTDRKMDRSHFIGSCWTNVDRTIINKLLSKTRQ